MYDIREKEIYVAILDDLFKKVKKYPKYDLLVLKGGFALSNILDVEVRMTKDIDISINELNIIEDFLYYLEKSIPEGNVGELQYSIVNVRKTETNGTVKIICTKLEKDGTSKDYKTNIDINYERGQVSVIFKDGMNIYSTIAMVVDKLVAISDYDRMRRRLKDLIDISLINIHLDGINAQEVIKELKNKLPDKNIKNSIDSESKYIEILGLITMFIELNGLSKILEPEKVLQTYIKIAEEVEFLLDSKLDWGN